jgi:Holliday junction resolvase
LVALAAAVIYALGSWLHPTETSLNQARTLSLPLVSRTPGGLLEVATVHTTELFEKKSMLTIAGLNMGTTVSQIRVPAVYRYQIRLAADWRAYVSGGKLLVIAPAMTPSLPVAVDTGKMEMQTTAGWARANAQENLEALHREITGALEVKAKSPQYVDVQREQARKTVVEFVSKWLLEQERWKHIKPEQVKVYFADEPIERLRSFGPEFGGQE